MRVVLLALVATLSTVSCRPDFGERESRVDRKRVLAVRIDPPEAKPGETVTTSLLVASPDGPVLDVPSSWAFCATPKLLTENGSVSAACLGDGVVPIGGGPTVSAVLPATSCFTFGPETQSAEIRPRDPDVTGGFFAPIRARLAGDGETLTAFGFARISCNLANASGDVATEFQKEYTPNKAPTLLPLEARDQAGVLVALDAVPRGARIVLRAAWRPEDAESYVVYDVLQLRIVPHRESLRASWFATAGTFENDRTGRTEEERETSTDNGWVAPEEARTSHLWVVLRDARGGVAFGEAALTTR
jgi:hypothetical protein